MSRFASKKLLTALREELRKPDLDEGSSEELEARIFMLDRRNTLHFCGNAYVLIETHSYQPVAGDLVLGLPMMPKITERDGSSAEISFLGNAIEIITGERFDRLLGRLNLKEPQVTGSGRLMIANDLIHTYFKNGLLNFYFGGQKEHTARTVITIEDLLASRHGECYEYSMVLTMLLNAYYDVPRVGANPDAFRLANGFSGIVRDGQDFIEVGDYRGAHSWVREGSHRVADPLYGLVDAPDSNPSLIPDSFMINGFEATPIPAEIHMSGLHNYRAYSIDVGDGSRQVYFERVRGEQVFYVLARKDMNTHL
ncbi:MAG: hypothetical protein KGH72_02405 [Candidatus Micrarchaeota archaeon]|nr:hypothetical protein [Candidatus Micrarchaeota archaeon]